MGQLNRPTMTLELCSLYTESEMDRLPRKLSENTPALYTIA